MKTLLTIIILLPMSLIAQKRMDSYTASNGLTYHTGDTVKIGRGSSPNGNFLYFGASGLFNTVVQTTPTSAGTDANMLNRSYAGGNAVIKKIYKQKFKGAEKIRMQVHVGASLGGFSLSIEEAIATCEVIPCMDQNTTTVRDDNKYDKLKKLKGLLDEGIITQDEFDSEKKKLLDEI